MDLNIREAVLEDTDWFLKLNAACEPGVGFLDEPRLRALESHAHAVLIAEDDEGERLGALVAITPGREYYSLNYRWFEREFDNFLYVDRIMVADSGRRKGVGLALYSEALEMAENIGAERVVAEVNVKPRNDVSLTFHDKVGFEKVGEQDLPDGKHVVMLSRQTLNPQE